MGVGELLEFGFSFGRYPDPDLSSVFFASDPFHQPPDSQPVYQTNGTVVLNQQVLSQHSHGRSAGLVHRADRQKDLVLLWLQPLGPGGVFAEVLKTANLITELRERLIVGRGEIGAGGRSSAHGLQNISYHDIVSESVVRSHSL